MALRWSAFVFLILEAINILLLRRQSRQTRSRSYALGKAIFRATSPHHRLRHSDFSRGLPAV